MNSFFEIDFLVQFVSEQEGNAEGISLCSVFSSTEEETEEQTKEQQVDDDDDDDDEGSDLLFKEQDDPLLVILCQKTFFARSMLMETPTGFDGRIKKMFFVRISKAREG